MPIVKTEMPFKERPLGELKWLIERLPRLDDEAERFEMDLKEIIKHQPYMPEKSKGRKRRVK